MAEDQDLSTILDTFDNYLALIENPNMGHVVSADNIAKIFECSRFVEAAAVEVLKEDKVQCFESHLQARWSHKNRTVNYSVSYFETACDRIVEVFLKDPSVQTLAIHKLLELYTKHCGTERLNNLLGNLLTDSMCTNVIIESAMKLGVSGTDIEDEALLTTWESEFDRGRHHEVSMCIKESLKDDCVMRIIKFASRLSEASGLKKLIMQNLATEAFDCKPTFFATLADMPKKLLCKLLRDSEFEKYFLDGVFYFGRNMERRGETWHCEHEFTYELLVRTIKNLLTSSAKIAETTRNRLEDVKVLDSTVWTDVEKDALR